MSRGVNNNSNNNIFNFYFNIGGGADACNALNTINQSPYWQSLQDSIAAGSGGCYGQSQIPGCGCVPTPQINMSAPPAGRGLQDTSGQCGWPANTTETAGGYHVVANGGARVTIYSPGQKPGEHPYASWDGDPHFHGGGKTVDFTGGKGADGQTGQDFVLGDGTRLFAQTAADHGHPVTTGLVIQNGADRREFSNMQGTPQGGQFSQDGYEWRAQHVAAGAEGNRATWYLRGDSSHMDIIQQSHGQIDGLVTGSHDEKGTYVADIDHNIRNAGIDPSLRPPIGTPASGNQLRDQVDDAQANYLSQFGPAGIWAATQNSYGIHANAIQGEFQSNLQQLFGGWPSYFNNYQSPFQALGSLRDLLLSDNEWQRSMRFQQYQMC